MLRNFHPSLLRLLRVFHAVAKYKGFTAAETVLNVGQPTISGHIKDLEDRLSFEVCERGRAGFRLTPAGERLYEATQRLERNHAEFVANVNAICNELQGSVWIGMTYLLSQIPLLTAIPAALGLLRREFPAIQVEIHLDTPREIEQGVIDGRYDIAISGIHLEAKNVEISWLFDMQMRLYCARGHELFDVEEQSIDDALLQKFAAVVNVYDTQRQIPFTGKQYVMSEASEASMFYVLSGMYVGYMSEFVATPWVKSGQLRALRPQKYYYEAPGGLIVPERATANPAVKKLVELLLHLAADRTAEGRHSLR